jgi:hypothetical protein
MTLRDDVLPVITAGWGIVATLGFSPYTLTVRTRTWTGGTGGAEVRAGTYADSDLVISPNFEAKETGGGGGLEIGPITPQHVGGGYTPEELNPLPAAAAGGEILYVVDGPAGQHLYTLIEIDTTDPVGYMLRLQALTRAVPF